MKNSLKTAIMKDRADLIRSACLRIGRIMPPGDGPLRSYYLHARAEAAL